MTAAAPQLARAMLESQLQDAIITLCRAFRLDVFHVRNSKGMTPGWPDLVIIGNRVIYRELKSEAGSLSPDQRRVGDRLAAAGADWAVWRPRDLRNGVIERQLRQLVPPPTLPFPGLHDGQGQEGGR